jgi:hypothetical protein
MLQSTMRLVSDEEQERESLIRWWSAVVKTSPVRVNHVAAALRDDEAFWKSLEEALDDERPQKALLMLYRKLARLGLLVVHLNLIEMNDNDGE